ncbi:DUF2971 domain-containing protein [Caulobacter segnis]|uniref:DUF2971 domain-containing protein n=1 Tax=Caulobacter segnis TaxID=88688 RepID=UPI00285B16B6|nr:DUF2971 domain-containing protein [Caulobacter segnis]MDR6624473.1 hypothetical protein [Caulobacter segnis]
MILYKYMSFELAKIVLATSTLQFSRCDRFNDPFDTPRYPSYPQEFEPAEVLARMTREMDWRGRTGLLCLTRTPTNPLMWAHYADSHRGVAIGIDATSAGLTNPINNLIPAQFGSVVYASRRPDWLFFSGHEPRSVGEVIGFDNANFERLQRLFLTKPIHWAYEEEVRVAKCLHGVADDGDTLNLAGDWSVQGKGAEARHLLRLPPGSFREVHFGIRTDTQESDDLRYAASKVHPDIKWLECALVLDAHTIEARDHVTVAEAMEI